MRKVSAVKMAKLFLKSEIKLIFIGVSPWKNWNREKASIKRRWMRESRRETKTRMN